MKYIVKKLLSYIPSSLPVGMTEFETFSQDIILLTGKGLENVPDDDKRFVIASAIQRLDATRNTIPKHYFVRLLRKAAASQVAGQVFLDIKERQKAAQAQAEATAQQQVADAQAQETKNL